MPDAGARPGLADTTFTGRYSAALCLRKPPAGWVSLGTLSPLDLLPLCKSGQDGPTTGYV
jgi:hypothetical protein